MGVAPLALSLPPPPPDPFGATLLTRGREKGLRSEEGLQLHPGRCQLGRVGVDMAGDQQFGLYLAVPVAQPAAFTGSTGTIAVTVTQESSGLRYTLTIPVTFTPTA